MADILPEPTDEPTPQPTVVSEPKGPRRVKLSVNKRTFGILIGLVIIALLALIAGYIYDYVTNHNIDNTRKQDLTYIENSLNGYYDLYHYYPTLGQLNSNTFGAFAPTLDHSKFKDPNSSSSELASKPQVNSYAYQTVPSNCNNTTITCVGYKLTATLSDGSQYVLTSQSNKAPSHSSKL